MPKNQALLAEFDREMDGTRKTLERIPEDKFGWKPHPKSGSLGWLATHVADMLSWTSETMTKDSVDVAPPGQEPPRMKEAKTRAELLEMFDRNRASAREAIAQATDEKLAVPWSLLMAGKPMFTMPRSVVLRSFIMNHLIHHRAQLTVYLRMNDVPVPALYGPSADESTF